MVDAAYDSLGLGGVWSFDSSEIARLVSGLFLLGPVAAAAGGILPTHDLFACRLPEVAVECKSLELGVYPAWLGPALRDLSMGSKVLHCAR